ncbi:ph-response sensor protein [Ascochyta clinopodiicola]|nr:ph-response sensor protein [Ascochyta clinopodiicola]
MTSSSKRDSVSSNSPAPSRSFLSRLRSPLSSKSRNFTDFYIQSDDPHRQYVPGDIISGTVIIKVVKPLRITHLVVSLHGYAQVFKNPNAPGDAYKTYSATVGSGRGKKQGSYFGNGFVSLFEDEVVLCGEGKLAEGVYHFNFDLEFPSKGLPSSIDFERGTVCYMLTSTLTRPTTMSPTATCDTKVSLKDVIDIAPIAEPKPRVISLEPISRRTRTKTPRTRPDTAKLDSVPPTPGGLEAPRLAPKLDLPLGTPEESIHPRSPSPSETSFASQMSSSGASGTEYGVRSVNTVTDAGGFIASNGSRPTVKGKTITATIDVLKGGFLGGDQIPIRVTVNHNKHVRSLKGIIITLYRQARVDMHPALPVAPNSKGDKTKSEDYYPKSRTGLGGLSLSSAGSSHTFRKDLGQSFAPLFVDPRTLTADIKCSVRVPDDVFPTISNVPGAMISFKYYVEVVVDIQGKLTGLDRMVSNAGVVTVPSSTASTPGGMGRDDAASNTFSTWGGNFVDTDGIRREKGVISSLFEVVVGTKDSERNGKRKQTQALPVHDQNGVHEIPYGSYDDPNASGAYDQYDYAYDENGQYYDYGYDPAYYDVPGYNDGGHGGSSSYNPPGPTQEEHGLSEKERLQRAEALLLPSQPPGAATGPSTANGGFQHGIPASAPMLPEDDESNPSYGPEASSSSSAPAHPPPPFRAATDPSMSFNVSTPRPSTQRRTTELSAGAPQVRATESSLTINSSQTATAPTTNDANEQSKPLPPLPPQSPPGTAPDYFPSSSHVPATDDKQEMQRQRLEMERSAPPPAHGHDEQGEGSQGPSAPPPANGMRGPGFAPGHLAPSAPMLNDEDEELAAAITPVRSRASNNRPVSEALPEYQR